ncbi:MAG: hypothetical protein IJX87_01040 [Clostridia bacterium]|nr:hypothetical protein [Clostridia bacterium]
MSKEIRGNEKSSLRAEARKAKLRMKSGFWLECKEDMAQQLEKARLNGLNESKAGQYFTAQVTKKISGEKEDEFYLRVKEMLTSEGEVSDAIGRLTDKEYYETLTYEEKQRYNLTLSEKYLRALERFRKECEFDVISRKA